MSSISINKTAGTAKCQFFKTTKVKKVENVKMKFKDAPIGARFRYPNSKKIWVKLNSYPKSTHCDGRGLICSWNGNINGFQSFCSFSEPESGIDFDTEVELI